MGAGIAQVMAVTGHEVVCHDVSAEALEAGRAEVDTGRFGLRSAVERGKLTSEQVQEALARLQFSGDVSALYDLDIIVEAVPERLDLKVAVLRDLDRRCSAH